MNEDFLKIFAWTRHRSQLIFGNKIWLITRTAIYLEFMIWILHICISAGNIIWHGISNYYYHVWLSVRECIGDWLNIQTLYSISRYVKNNLASLQDLFMCKACPPISSVLKTKENCGSNGGTFTFKCVWDNLPENDDKMYVKITFMAKWHDGITYFTYPW